MFSTENASLGRNKRTLKGGGQAKQAEKRLPFPSSRSRSNGQPRFWNIYGRRSATQQARKISAKFRSFSAVSAPIFASKYAFFSIFQNLPDYRAEIFEIWQNFADFATFAKFLLNLEFSQKLLIFKSIFAKKLRLQRCKRMQIL